MCVFGVHHLKVGLAVLVPGRGIVVIQGDWRFAKLDLRALGIAKTATDSMEQQHCKERNTRDHHDLERESEIGEIMLLSVSTAIASR